MFLKQILSFSFSGYILYISLSHLWIVGHLMPGNSPFEETRVDRWNLNHTKVFVIYLVLLNLWTQECANCVLSPKTWSSYWTRLIFLIYHAEPIKRRATKFVTKSLYSATSIKKSKECEKLAGRLLERKGSCGDAGCRKGVTGREQDVFEITFSWENGQSSWIYQLVWSQSLHSWATSAWGSFVHPEQVAFLKRAKLGISLKFWRLPWFQYFYLRSESLRLHCQFQNNHTWRKNKTFLLVGVRGLEHTRGTEQIFQLWAKLVMKWVKSDNPEPTGGISYRARELI